MRIRAINIILFPALFFHSQLLQAQVFYDDAAAFQEAKSKHIPIMLVFTGSDWCRSCKRFEQNILLDSVFTSFADNRLVILIADFPKRTVLPAHRKAANEKLAEQFNPTGQFPTIVLLTDDRKVIGEMNYVNEGPATFVAALSRAIAAQPVMREYKKRVALMGSFFEFVLVDSVTNERKAWKLINDATEEVSRIEQLISEWISTSKVSELNRCAGKHPVKISPELYTLIQRSIAIGDLTQGAFDISFLPLMNLWKFDGKYHELTDADMIREAVNLVGYSKIQLLDSGYVFLPDAGMKIGFGGIGQGYAVDRVAKLFLDNHINNFLINSSGDIYARGKRADGMPWKIGIANPFSKNEIIRWITAENMSVVTSGNYEKFFENNGTRYAHIINPKTGYPTHDIVSVTVVSPIAEISDALATAIFVLGTDAGIHLVEQVPGTFCIIVDKNRSIHYSAGVEEL